MPNGEELGKKKIYLEKILSITISFIFSSIWYRLNDVLKDYDLKGIKHVQFEGYDEGSDGSPYGASIPIEKAMSGDVILAYEMNEEILPRDHGYPIRVVATGIGKTFSFG